MTKSIIKHSHISDAKIRQIIKHFSFNLTASKTTELLKISRPTINEYFNKFRQIIFSFLGGKNQKNNRNRIFGGTRVILDLNERVRGKRGRGVAGKTPVFGLLKRDGNF